MFDAHFDMKFIGPLLTRAVEALESMAQSQKQLATTAQLQAKVLETHPHNKQQSAPHGDIASVTALRPVPRATK